MRILLAAVTVLLLGACASDHEPVLTDNPAETAHPGALDAPLEAEELNPEAAADLVDHGEVSLLPPPPSRLRQRMNLDQLAATIDRTTGGLAWTEGTGANQTDLFRELAATLGKPDYVQITQEDLSPSSLFQKFLDDAARDVCLKLVTVETTAPELERHLMIHVEPTDDLEAMSEGIDANLQELLLRFHGKRLEADAPELVQWRWLATSVANVTQSPTQAWRAVCVALITHPQFYSY